MGPPRRRYKLIERATGRSALYDLASEPLELHNRIDDPALADVRDRLRARLLRDVIARAEQFPARWEPMVAIAPPAPPREATGELVLLVQLGARAAPRSQGRVDGSRRATGRASDVRYAGPAPGRRAWRCQIAPAGGRW